MRYLDENGGAKHKKEPEMDEIEKQAIRLTYRFYNNLGITDETQFDGLKMDVETVIRRFAKEEEVSSE